MKNFLEGYNTLKQLLGYEPDFCNHLIKKIIFNDRQVEMQIETQDGISYTLVFESIRGFNFSRNISNEPIIISAINVEKTELQHFGEQLKITIDSSIDKYELLAKKILLK